MDEPTEAQRLVRDARAALARLRRRADALRPGEAEWALTGTAALDALGAAGAAGATARWLLEREGSRRRKRRRLESAEEREVLGRVAAEVGALAEQLLALRPPPPWERAPAGAPLVDTRSCALGALVPALRGAPSRGEADGERAAELGAKLRLWHALALAVARLLS